LYVPDEVQDSHRGKKAPNGYYQGLSLLFAIPLPRLARLHQTTTHSPGWVVLARQEYRTLHARALPTEREPEPTTRRSQRSHDVGLDRSHRLVSWASGRRSLNVDVLRDGWGRVPVPEVFWFAKPGSTGKLFLASPGAWLAKRAAQLSRSFPIRASAVLLLISPFCVVCKRWKEYHSAFQPFRRRS